MEEDCSSTIDYNLKQQTIPIYSKEDYLNEEKHYYFEEETSEGEGIRYQIKINDDQDFEVSEDHEDHLIEERFAIEPDNEESGIDLDREQEKNIDSNKSQYGIVIVGRPDEEVKLHNKNPEVMVESILPEQPTNLSLTTMHDEQQNTTDPDERYLLSCLPAFKRFSPQQKAFVRMGIERLFYEVEFEKISEPARKKFKS